LTTNSVKRIDDLEILRALAVLFTMFEHVQYLLPPGNEFLKRIQTHFSFWTGVDLFFAISGFVIARDLIGKLQAAQRFDQYWRVIVAFWIKRAFRIWPSSWLWLVVLLVCSFTFARSNAFHPLRADLADFLASIVQVQNFHLWDCIAHNRYERCGDAGSWWSLSLEEQFYIALPIAAILLRKYLPLFIIVLVVLQIATPRATWSILWAIRTDAIGLGVLLAICSKSEAYKIPATKILRHRSVQILVMLSLLIALAAAPIQLNFNADQGLSTGVVAIIAALLVYIGSLNCDYIGGKGNIKKLSLWIGSRSYAIYLIHFPMIAITKALWWSVMPIGTTFGANFSLRYIFVWLSSTFVLSEINYRFVEQPMRYKGKLIAQTVERSDGRIEEGIVSLRKTP
jgi:peptidoglycan/LPS O-acetylase OafA/YrhL